MIQPNFTFHCIGGRLEDITYRLPHHDMKYESKLLTGPHWGFPLLQSFDDNHESRARPPPRLPRSDFFRGEM